MTTPNLPDRAANALRRPAWTAHLLPAFTLFCVVWGAYLLTYRGAAMSGDELFIFDTATAFAREGAFYRAYDYNSVVAPPNTLQPGPDGAPWLRPVQEPLMAMVVAPLIRLGQGIDGVGTMHVVWTVNTVITALTAVSLYAIARWWGFSAPVGWGLGLAFGLGTNAWFYSRLLFREPLTALLILWAFAFAVAIGRRWRSAQREASRGGGGWAYVGLTVCFSVAFITKTATILFLPAVLLAVVPPLGVLRRRWRVLVGLGIGLALGAALFVLIMSNSEFAPRYALDGWFYRLRTIQWNYVLESILGYQVSFARSLWLYSPILLAGLVGGIVWLGQGEWRLIVGPALAVLLTSMWYGISFTVDWLGGWSWGPRYLLPLVPVLMLWVLPVLPRLTTLSRRMAFGALLVCSAAVQLLGLSVPISNYFTDLYRSGKIYDYAAVHTNRAAIDAEWAWMDMAWRWEWSPPYYHLTHLNLASLDMAWAVARVGWLPPLLFAGGIGLAGLAAVLALRTAGQRWTRRAAVVLCAAAGGLLALTLAFGLTLLRDDPRYVQTWPEVATLIDRMNVSVAPGDTVFIDRHLYTPLFMNDFKPAVLVATLPYAPGETAAAAEQRGLGDDLVTNAGVEAVYALDWSAAHAHTLWLVASAGPAEPDQLRPIERYLVTRYFPIEEITVASRARAIRFWPVPAPDGPPAYDSTASFGGLLALRGFDLPAGAQVAAGDVLPVSLVWEAQVALTVDYNVSVFLQAADGATVTQRDGTPQATFGATSQWQPGTRYRDNHGLALPAALPPGEYRLAVAVYDWRDVQRLPLAGDTRADYAALATITVSP